MLSGKAFVPGMGIDSNFWVATSTVAKADRPSMLWATERTRGTVKQNVRNEAD
jgi:hypothetical protein